ncbi:MAG: hypothetical protein GC153_01575 [Alphaproteobacteria bacterium]|nr:hypothetical protein [Alphaproteobacteria bacterium]
MVLFYDRTKFGRHVLGLLLRERDEPPIVRPGVVINVDNKPYVVSEVLHV